MNTELIADLARATLERQVRELERIERVLSDRRLRLAAYDHDEFEKALASGRPHLRRALRDARAALAAGDPEMIIVRAMTCGSLIMDGFAAALRNEIKTRRINGGKKTGSVQAAKARKKYDPWQSRWRELCAKHNSTGTAREIHRKEMAKAGLDVTARTHQRHFR